MKKILLAIMMATGVTCFGAAPPKYLDVDVNWQQTQELETLNIQQGASMRLRVRPRVDGKRLTLTGLTARWEARETATNTSSYQATSNLTSNDAHWIQIELDNTQTGTAITDWLYSIILIDGADEYPIGIGTIQIVASDFAGSSSVLVGTGYETNSVDVTDTVSTINFSTGITAVHDGANKLTLSVASGAGGDITGVTAGTWLSGGGASGDVTVNVATSTVMAAVAAVGYITTDTGATNIVAGATDSYNTGTRTLTWNTNAVSSGGGSGDLTEVQVSGDMLTVTSGTGPIPIVGLTTAAVQAAQSPEADTLADVTGRGNATADHLDLGGTWHITNITSLVWSGGESISVNGSLQNASSVETLDWDARALRLAWTVTTDATSGQQAVGWSVLTNQIELLSPSYTAGTNLTLNGAEFNLNAAAVASLAKADTALQAEADTFADVIGRGNDGEASAVSNLLSVSAVVLQDTSNKTSYNANSRTIFGTDGTTQLARFQDTWIDLLKIVEVADEVRMNSNVITGVLDHVYGATWNGNTSVPTKNALYDKIETISGGGGGNPIDARAVTQAVDFASFAATSFGHITFSTNSAAVAGVANELVQYVKDGRLYSIYNSVTNYAELD